MLGVVVWRLLRVCLLLVLASSYCFETWFFGFSVKFSFDFDFVFAKIHLERLKSSGFKSSCFSFAYYFLTSVQLAPERLCVFAYLLALASSYGFKT